MPSSPTFTPRSLTAPDLTELLTVLGSVPDPRDRRGVRHSLPRLLSTGIAAVVAGARSFAAIGEYAAAQARDDADPWLVRTPDESTFRRVFARVDADKLAQVLGAWLWTRTAVIAGRRVIAIDGKTVRGARRPGQAAPHLVAALDQASGAVLGQLAVAAKSNEIPAVRTLLTCFDLSGAVVTVDAMHTQHDTARAITEAGGDYLLTELTAA